MQLTLAALLSSSIQSWITKSPLLSPGCFPTPKQLIHRIEALLAKLPEGLTPETILLEGDCPILSDEIMDDLDRIMNSARVLFGSTVKPGESQSHQLEVAGYKITCAEPAIGRWKTGFINTPKGKIRYN